MDTGEMFVPRAKVDDPIDVFVPVSIKSEWEYPEQIQKLQLTSNCFTKLYANTAAPFHLIISDDSDDPFSPVYFKELQKKHDNITYLHHKERHKSGNWLFNLGFKHSKHSYIAVMSNSMVVEPEWDVVAADVLNKESDVAVVGLKCLFPHGKIESAGITMLNYTPVDIGRDLPSHRQTALYECPAVQWAFAMVRKDAVGVLDEDTYNPFKGWDDIDNCFVIRKNGWKIMYCGYGVGYHYPRATRGTDTVEGHKLNKENARTFYKRWGYWERFLKENPDWEVEADFLEAECKKIEKNKRRIARQKKKSVSK